MIPVYQTMTVANDGEGNCFNACVASIMERPLRDVAAIHPRFDGNYWGAWQDWFTSQGLKLVWHRDLSSPPKGYAIASGMGGRYYPEDHDLAGEEIGHAAVVFNGLLVHDPFPGATQFDRIDKYWTIEMLEPRNEADATA